MTVKSLKSHVAPARRREKGSLTPSLSGPLVLPPIVDAPGPASKPAPVPGNSGAIALGSSLGSTAPASGVVMDPRQRNCVEILTAGFVQAYVDFFFLTHRTDPNPGV
ncbi:MAG: hypothetical protein P4L40_05430, partial [Terracidiphilus sp.]|nr:hypothetical protein [Terracidiphilus sp.]